MVVMTMNEKRRRTHDKLAALPGVRSVRRPVGDGREFDLFYVRTGEPSEHPTVVIPGGPGAASIALYRAMRGRWSGFAGADRERVRLFGP